MAMMVQLRLRLGMANCRCRCSNDAINQTYVRIDVDVENLFGELWYRYHYWFWSADSYSPKRSGDDMKCGTCNRCQKVMSLTRIWRSCNVALMIKSQESLKPCSRYVKR
ncbi:hypothetical protein U1Q18_049738 [Sarracenia purpurea var. burkii]